MKHMLKFLSICCLFTFSQLTAQDLAYKKYTWDSNPKLHTLSAEESEANYVILKDKIMLEFVYEASGQLVMYETRHTIIHLNNEKGIEEMNKIYVSYAKILEEMDLKARTINAEGKIIPLSKSSVKKVDDLENAGPFLIFAMEGVDKGSEIEYLYTNKKSSVTNNSWKMQSDVITKNVNIDIISPENLVFEGKGYNGFPEFTKDTTVKEKNHILAAIDLIPALTEEKYSAYEANKMRFDYQLTYNAALGKSRLYSWEYTGLQLYNSLFNFEKGETKAMEKLVSKLGLSKMASDEDKMRALEQYMKTNINMKETEEEVTIDKMLDQKYGDETNLQKIYLGVAKLLNIPVEIVLTTDRMKRKFDPNFASWNSLQEYLTYFPSIGKYISADNYSSRIGFAPPELLGGKGLFIKETEIGDIKTGISKIKSIETQPYTVSWSNIKATVTFDDSFTPKVNLAQEWMGFPAYYFQPSMMYLNDAQRKEFLDGMAKLTGKETVVKSVDMKGVSAEDILVKPMIVEAVVEMPHLIENAGNKYLFKVGEMIGPQEELYQDKSRQSDGEIEYTHSFTRDLEIKIPAGYKIKNLDDINIKKEYHFNGAVLSSFVSSYTLEGDVLKIKVYEDYQTLTYPKANYEEFRAVVNASADFNKVILIMEKI